MEPNFKVIADLFQVAQPADLEVLEQTRKRHGDTAEESRAMGSQCLNQGDYDNALRHFREAVSQSDPNDVDSLVDLGGAFEYGDDFPQALRQYEKALRSKHDSVEPAVGVADLYKRYGRFKDAIEKLEEATRKEPKNAFLYIKLSETLRDARERKRALVAAQSAIAAKPDDAFNHYWTGDLLIEMERYDEALEYLRAAIELSPGDDFLYLRTMVAFWCAGRKIEAIKALRLASDLDPEKHLYHGLLGILLEESGLADEAALESERAKKMDRFDDDLLGRLIAEMKIEL